MQGEGNDDQVRSVSAAVMVAWAEAAMRLPAKDVLSRMKQACDEAAASSLQLAAQQQHGAGASSWSRLYSLGMAKLALLAPKAGSKQHSKSIGANNRPPLLGNAPVPSKTAGAKRAPVVGLADRLAHVVTTLQYKSGLEVIVHTRLRQQQA